MAVTKVRDNTIWKENNFCFGIGVFTQWSYRGIILDDIRLTNNTVNIYISMPEKSGDQTGEEVVMEFKNYIQEVIKDGLGYDTLIMCNKRVGEIWEIPDTKINNTILEEE